MGRFFFAAALLVGASPALAGLDVCNETDARVGVAIGYRGDGDWLSEGWWRVEPGGCSTVIGGALDLSHYYLRMTSPAREFEHEGYYFCTSPEIFTIMGDTDCAARGHDRERFIEIQPNAGSTEHIHYVRQTRPGGDPPGTHGEPYTVSGLLSHCDVTDASIQCEMHAPPWRYVASGHGPTDIGLLEDMLTWPENTPVTWEGDMMGYVGNTADVTVRSASREGADPFAGLRLDLQGSWVSAADSNYMLIVNGGVFEEWYGGAPSDTRLMELAAACPGSIPDEKPALIAHSSDGATQCFTVDWVGGGELTIWPEGVMQPLDFFQNGQ